MDEKIFEVCSLLEVPSRMDLGIKASCKGMLAGGVVTDTMGETDLAEMIDYLPIP